MATTLRSVTRIDAPRAVVWDVLLDLERYPSWNPYYVEVAGRVAVGERLGMKVRLDDSRRRATARPRVLEVVPHERVVWRNQLLMPGLLTAVHAFSLQADAAGTLLEQTETFTGLLLPVSTRALRKVAHKLDELGDALRTRSCEMTVR